MLLTGGRSFRSDGRFVGHVMQTAAYWHLVYVDDLHGALTGPLKFELLWVWLLAFEVMGLHLVITNSRVVSLQILWVFIYGMTGIKLGLQTKEAYGFSTGFERWRRSGMLCRQREFSEFLGRLGFVAQLLTWLKPHLSPLFAWSAVASPGLVGRLPDTVILTLYYIAAEMSGETFLISAKRPVFFNAEQFRTDAKCTQDIIVLGGWELESKRWFSLNAGSVFVPA